MEKQYDDVKTYQIQGETLEQKHLTIGQVRKLTELIKDAKFDGLSPAGIVNRLVDSDVLDRVLAIVLNGPDDFRLQVDAMYFDELVEIIQDFLSCNNVAGLFGSVISGMEAFTNMASPEPEKEPVPEMETE